MGWSEWITPAPDDHPAFGLDRSHQLAHRYVLANQYVYPGHPVASLNREDPHDYVGIWAAMVAGAYAGAPPAHVDAQGFGGATPYSPYGSGTYAYLSYGIRKSATPVKPAPHMRVEGDWGLSLQQNQIVYDPINWATWLPTSPTDPALSAMNHLVRGVDYTENPATDLAVQYETSRSVFLGWRSWDAVLVQQYFSGSSHNSADTGPVGPLAPMRVAIEPVVPGWVQRENYTVPPPWRAAGAGRTVAVLDTLGAAVPAAPGSYRTDLPLDLAGLVGGSAAFRVLLTPAGSSYSFRDVSTPLPEDLSIGEDGDYNYVSSDLGAEYGGGYFSNSTFATTQVRIDGMPTSRWQRPRYHYWVPDLMAPSLRQARRNDGLGPTGHPRLTGATSTQRGQAPRVGTKGRYS